MPSYNVDDESNVVRSNNRIYTTVTVKVLCQRDKRHQLGRAMMYLDPFPQAGEIIVGEGLRWDESDRAVGDCRECRVTGRGSDQRISRARLTEKLNDLLSRNRHAGTIQA